MSELRDKINKSMSEAEYLAQIISLLELLGWEYYHVFEQRAYARRTSKGFPDIVAIRHTRVLFLEVKSERGKVSPEQKTWLNALKATGNEAYVLRPSDWEAVVALLKRE